MEDIVRNCVSSWCWPQVFEFLADDMAHNVRINGEFQFTPALQRLRETEGGLLGLVVDGQRFDIGTPGQGHSDLFWCFIYIYIKG
jgi:UTP-glucose-1-phosphate uridylyltransferase